MARRRTRQKAAPRQSTGFFTFLPWVSTSLAPLTPSRWDGRERALRFYLAFVRRGATACIWVAILAPFLLVANYMKTAADLKAAKMDPPDAGFLIVMILGCWFGLILLSFLISLGGDAIELALRAVAASEAAADHTEKMSKNIAWLAQNEYSKNQPRGGGRSAVADR